MKTIRWKSVLLILLCLFLLSASALASSPDEIFTGQQEAYKEELDKIRQYLSEQLPEETAAGPEDPVSYDLTGAIRCLMFDSLEGADPESVLSGTVRPDNVQWQIPCVVSSGEAGILCVDLKQDGSLEFSCALGAAETEFLPDRETAAAEISQLVGSDVDKIAYVTSYDYGITSFFLVSSGDELHLIPYRLGWDTPEVDTLSYFTKGSPVSSSGRSTADPEELFSFLNQLREAQIGADEAGEPLFGNPQVVMEDGVPVIRPLSESSDSELSPSPAPAQTWGLVAVLLLIFIGMAYGPQMFARKS